MKKEIKQILNMSEFWIVVDSTQPLDDPFNQLYVTSSYASANGCRNARNKNGQLCHVRHAQADTNVVHEAVIVEDSNE